jgi:hypothetical protein
LRFALHTAPPRRPRRCSRRSRGPPGLAPRGERRVLFPNAPLNTSRGPPGAPGPAPARPPPRTAAPPPPPPANRARDAGTTRPPPPRPCRW